MKEGASIYLAGPLDYAELGGHGAWRTGVQRHLGDLCLFNPEYAFAGQPLVAPQALRAINLAAVRACTGMLAAVFPRHPSWGTPIEIALAEQLGKPVMLWSPEARAALPPYLVHLPCERILAKACTRLKAMVEAVLEEGEFVGKAGVYRVGGPELRLLATIPAIESPKMAGDVGYDLRLMETVTILPGAFVCLPLGVWSEEAGPAPLRVAIPDGQWGTFLPRSGLASHGLLVHPTVIDPGYRGPLYAFAYYAGTEALILERGQRVCQLVLFNSVTPELALVEELPDSERGNNGFGSTGDH